jgi:hypothetical protein
MSGETHRNPVKSCHRASILAKFLAISSYSLSYGPITDGLGSIWRSGSQASSSRRWLTRSNVACEQAREEASGASGQRRRPEQGGAAAHQVHGPPELRQALSLLPALPRPFSRSLVGWWAVERGGCVLEAMGYEMKVRGSTDLFLNVLPTNDWTKLMLLCFLFHWLVCFCKLDVEMFSCCDRILHHVVGSVSVTGVCIQQRRRCFSG